MRVSQPSNEHQEIRMNQQNIYKQITIDTKLTIPTPNEYIQMKKQKHTSNNNKSNINVIPINKSEKLYKTIHTNQAQIKSNQTLQTNIKQTQRNES